MATDPPTVTVNAKAWYESRTVVFNILSMLAVTLTIIIDNAAQLGLPPQALAWAGVLIAIINAALRFVTSAPLASGTHQTAEVEGPAAPSAEPRTLTEISDTSGNFWDSRS